jgi:VWFA-related protein
MKKRVRIVGLVVVGAVAVLSAGQTPPSNPQSPTFQIQVDYVEVDAIVTDRDGRFARDLKKEDFQVFEDGKPQTINTFALVDIPVEHNDRPLFAPQPIEPDVRTNARPFDGRVYVLVLDDLHVQASHTPLVRNAGRRFIQQNLGANDLMAVVHVNGRTSDSQDLTNSKGLLLASVDKFLGRAERSSTLARSDLYTATTGVGVTLPGNGVPADPGEQQRGFDAKRTLDALESIENWFGSVRGRKKSILLVSEGIDYDIEDIFNKQDATSIIVRTQDVIRAAAKSNVSIYSIDPRGLTDQGDQNIELAGVQPGDSINGPQLNQRGLQNELRLQLNSLRTFAEQTGGFAVVSRNDFADAFRKIVEENSSYYVLAYYPPNPKPNGRYHSIQVRVSRPGLTVRARDGYAAPTAKALAASASAAKTTGPLTPEARDALQSPLPVSGLTMQVFAAPFKGTAPNESVLLGVELNGRDLTLDAGSKLQLAYVAIDGKSQVKDSHTDQMVLNLRPETRAAAQRTGLRVLTRVSLPPGRYQFRVTANDLTSRAVGSVLYDLDVPDFAKSALALSGIALTSLDSSREPTIRADPELKQAMPGPPVGNRVFPPNDELAVFAEIYDNDAEKKHSVDITTTITSDEGKVVYKTEDTRESTELQGHRGGYGYAARVPLKDLPNGLYVLKVEARSRLGQNTSVDRQIQFRIAETAAAQSQ